MKCSRLKASEINLSYCLEAEPQSGVGVGAVPESKKAREMAR